MVFDYLDSGADDEISLRRGKDAYSELEMHYKILAGIKKPLLPFPESSPESLDTSIQSCGNRSHPNIKRDFLMPLLIISGRS